jgi:hypothetical protein
VREGVHTKPTQANKAKNKMTYQTLEQALKTKAVKIISVEAYEHNGQARNWIKVMKANGKKVFRVAQYSNGRFSEAV